MITLSVKRDKKGRLILLDYDKTKVKLVFSKAKKLSNIDRKIRKMWKDMDVWVAKSSRNESFKSQQRWIRNYAKETLGVDLTWASCKDMEGWPTSGWWETNQRWFSKELRRLLEEKKS